MGAAHPSYFAETAMLIRKPIAEVFEAFVNPEITTKFWFTKSTGKVEAGKQVDWIWEMYGVTVHVLVKSVVANKSIVIEWGDDFTKLTRVEWTFTPMDDHSTFVNIVNDGFTGNVDEIVTQVRNSTSGFTLVLAGLKAYLEHNMQLNLIADRFPEGKK